MSYSARFKLIVDGETTTGALSSRGPLGDVVGMPEWKDLLDEAERKKCEAAERAASAKLEGQTLELARSWKPTGFYAVADLEKMLTQTRQILTDAGAALEQMINNRFEVKDTALSLRTTISNRFGDSLAYGDAIKAARAAGITVIDAPGFKRWVIKSMNEAQIAYEHVAYVACIRPFMLVALAAAYTAFEVAVTIAKAMGEVVIQAGQVVLKVPDTLSTLVTVAKWGALGYGALWIAMQVKKARGG